MRASWERVGCVTPPVRATTFFGGITGAVAAPFEDCDFFSLAATGSSFFCALASGPVLTVERVDVDGLGRSETEGPVLGISFFPCTLELPVLLPAVGGSLESTFLSPVGLSFFSATDRADAGLAVSELSEMADDAAAIWVTARFAAIAVDALGPCRALSSRDRFGNTVASAIARFSRVGAGCGSGSGKGTRCALPNSLSLMEVGSARRGPVCGFGTCTGRCAGSGLWTCVVVDREDGASARRSGRSGPLASCRTAGSTGRSGGAVGSDPCGRRWGMIAGGGISSSRLDDGPGTDGPSDGANVPSVRLRVSFDATPMVARVEDETERWCARDVAGRGWGSTLFGGTDDMEDAGRVAGIVCVD